MFGQHIYQSQNLSQLYNNSLPRSKHLKQIQLRASERSLLINTIHMLLDMPSDIYPLKSSPGNKQKYFFVASQGIQVEHLSLETLKTCLNQFAEYGKQIQYVKYQSQRIYQFSNALLKAFVQNVYEILKMIEIYMTNKLKILQQENGKIERTQTEYQRSREKPMTLMSFLQQLKTFKPILSLIVGVYNKIGLKEGSSVQDLQKGVLFLLNLYFQQCSKQYCLKGVHWSNFLHILYKNIIKEYFNICKDWFQMNESVLAMKVHFGFFVQLDQIINLDQQKIFDLKKITKKESIPQLFRNNHKKIIQLGKTIQFIKLYFRPQERESYRNYMNIEGEFSVLFQYLNSLSERKQQQFVFFKPKPLKYQTISSKLSSMIQPSVTFTKITKDNPFNMYPSVSGILNLRSHYKFKHTNDQKQNQIDILNSSLGPKMEDSFTGLDINRRIQQIFNDILQKITWKCLVILQNQKIRQSISRTLRGIKKIMLFQQGDFIQQFVELTRQLLQKPSEKISRNNIQRFIEEAVRTSGAKFLSQILRQNISFVYLKNTQGIKGWRIFSLMYKPQKPTHCIFTTKVMNDYSYLSNMMFNLRHCQVVLTEVWSNTLCEGMGIILKARNAVHHYVKALQAYIFSQVEVLWNQLLDSIQQNGNILTILEANQNILHKIKTITFQNQTLCTCLLSLDKIVDKFQAIHKNLQDGFDQNIRSDIDQIWSWFLAILDHSRQINHFCDTFDFRGEYSL